MASLAVDEELLRRMSDLIVAVNRRKHAEQRGPNMEDPSQIRLLVADEQRAEEAYVQALVSRGWRSAWLHPIGA